MIIFAVVFSIGFVKKYFEVQLYNAFNVYRRELAPGTVSLTGDRAQGDDSKHWAYNSPYSTLMTMYLPGAILCSNVL